MFCPLFLPAPEGPYSLAFGPWRVQTALAGLSVRRLGRRACGADAFKQLRDFIDQDLRLFSDKLIYSYNAFIPIFDYLFHNPKPNEKSRGYMRACYYKSQFFGWYSGSTDTILNGLHGIVGIVLPGGFPLLAIKEYFRTKFRGVELMAHHLQDKRLRAAILSMVYVERWGASPFKVLYKGNEPHIDHIYPQYMLRTHLEQNSDQINDIGNLRFVGATDNCRKRGELPASYFSRLKAYKVDIEKHLLVPEFSASPEKMLFDAATYAHFREQRRKIIWEIGKRVVDPEV